MSRLQMPMRAGVFVLLTLLVDRAAGDVIVTVNPPFSDPPFAVTASHTVAYFPSTGIDLTVPSGFPQPNTDVEDDNKFGVSLNYGGTGYTVLTSRHIYENSPELALTIGNLIPGQSYQVLAATFVNSGFDLYGGKYGFESGKLSSYFYSSGGNLLATGANGPNNQGQFQIREFNLGQHPAVNGELTIYVDDFDGASLVGNLASIRLVAVPEPTTIQLASTALVAIASYLASKRVILAKRQR